MGVASIPGCVIRALVPDHKSGRRLYTRPRSNELAPSGLSYRLPKIGRLSTSMAEKYPTSKIGRKPARPRRTRLSESYSRPAHDASSLFPIGGLLPALFTSGFVERTGLGNRSGSPR